MKMKRYFLPLLVLSFGLSAVANAKCAIGYYLDCDADNNCTCSPVSTPDRISSGSRVNPPVDPEKAIGEVEITMTNFTKSDYTCTYDYTIRGSKGKEYNGVVKQYTDAGSETIETHKVYNFPKMEKPLRIWLTGSTVCFEE